MKAALIIIFCLGLSTIYGFDLATYKKQLYDKQNELRKKHGADALTPDSNIENRALEYAQKLLNEGGALVHDEEALKKLGYGENLFSMSGSFEPNGETAADSWYSEIKDYNFNNPGFDSKTGHFTQLVWKASKKVGCGAAFNGNKLVTCCNYSPPGNYKGQYEANVLRENGNGNNGGDGNGGNNGGDGNNQNIISLSLIGLFLLSLLF